MATQKMLLAATLLFLVLLSLIGPSSAHMVMSDPPPINYKDNPFYTESKGDFDYTAPISPSGSNYPCRGHLKDLDTPQGGSVKTWAAGSTQTLTIAGSAVHGGGSCQAALSYDKGTTWVVIKSWIGNCPHATPGGDQTFKLPIPSGAPSGNKVLFAWTWFNNVGNREMYMNCAVVTITGGGSSKLKSRALNGPTIFLANIGNGCTTAAGTDVVFPNPGDTVEYGGSESERAPPSGNCAGGTGSATGSGSGSGSGSSSGSGTGSGSGSSSGSGNGSGSGSGSNSGSGQGETTISFSYGSNAATTTAYSPPSYTTLYSSSLNTRLSTAVVGGGFQTSIYSYPTATIGGGVEDSAATNVVPGTGGSNLGCDYWRTQGYVCSGASPSLLGRFTFMNIIFGFLAFGWITLRVV